MSQPSDNAQIILPLINYGIYDHKLFFHIDFIKYKILFKSQHTISLPFEYRISGFISEKRIFRQF